MGHIENEPVAEGAPPDLGPELRAVGQVLAAVDGRELPRAITAAAGELVPCQAVSLVWRMGSRVDVAWWPAEVKALKELALHRWLDEGGMDAQESVPEGVLMAPLSVQATAHGCLAFARETGGYTSLERARAALLASMGALALDRAQPVDPGASARMQRFVLELGPRLHSAVDRLHAHLRHARQGSPGLADLVPVGDAALTLSDIASDIQGLLRRRPG